MNRQPLPSPRRLDILAAWWREGCSCAAAGRRLNLSDQIIRNELHRLRREFGVKDNMILVRRWSEHLKERELRRTVSRKAA